ncbi:MAG: hypothetical protein HQ494_12970 [Rhodospirillales bacterium]|nr:hypothetical protein [Rhodospirillales bacterium]
MPAIEQALISFFEQVAQKDKALLETLVREPCFSIDLARWCFTLPDLHRFLQQRGDVFSALDYQQFRKLIFNNPINSAVKVHGAEITIADNQTNVDKSTYALVWPASPTVSR